MTNGFAERQAPAPSPDDDAEARRLDLDLRRDLEAAARQPDAAIDFADAPEVTDWSAAERGRFWRPVKQQVTLRLDADVIEHFRRTHRDGGYQTAINAALREAMDRQRTAGRR